MAYGYYNYVLVKRTMSPLCRRYGNVNGLDIRIREEIEGTNWRQSSLRAAHFASSNGYMVIGYIISSIVSISLLI
jgi:hypothetical protein